MEQTYEVSEKMSKFIDWCYELGEEEVRRRVREKLAALKEERSHFPPGMKNSSGEAWDNRLEPNDDNDQWRHGGDCNLCRRISYCQTKCKANKLLKSITTMFLYDMYVEEHPEALAEDIKKNITPQDLLKAVGVDGKLDS